MNLSFSVEDEAFREDVRAFLDANLTPDLRARAARMTSVYTDKAMALEWQAILHAKGWAAPAWPAEHGGCDWTVAQHYIFDLELSRAGAPGLSPMGISMCGPALLGHGSEAQKAQYLPRILSGEDFWCQGYSEPQAGSDLASLGMTAERDGDDFICNGSKIWTTHAHEANMMFCLVRTDGSGKPQLGITFILLDMNTPGVTVDPMFMMSGEHLQNQVFFDNVRVPVANVVGEIDRGWTVAKYLLEFERGGHSYAPRLLDKLGKLRQLAREHGGLTSDMMVRIAQVEVELMALEAAELELMATLSHGGTPGLKASMMKIRGTELSQRVTEIAVEISGYMAAPYQPHHTEPGGPVMPAPAALNAPVGDEAFLTAMPRYLNDRAGSIYAGSNEIQRNILAKGQLGL